jgi:hypothetical protein
MADAWARRTVASPGGQYGGGEIRRRGQAAGAPDVILVHYDDLLADLAGQMRWLAALLGTPVPAGQWPGLVKAATFEQMRASAAAQAPDAAGVLKDPAAFFRRGTSGAGRELLMSAELERYHARAAALADPGMLAWLHRPPG